MEKCSQYTVFKKGCKAVYPVYLDFLKIHRHIKKNIQKTLYQNFNSEWWDYG